jgi:MATE family multidrug resistance protein
MSSATETLCGQAFGTRQYHMMGIYLQRSWIVDVTTATIMIPLFVFTTPLFRLFGEDEEIAVESGPIALWMIGIIYSYVFALTMQMFLQAQLKNMIVGCLSASSFVIHLLLSWVFVEILDLEVAGAMGAYCISSWLMVFGEYAYVFGGWCPDTWKGFTKAAFYDILPVIKLSISSGVMLW